MKTAYLITGASRGLGAAIAAGAAGAGSPILAISRSKPPWGEHLAADFRQTPQLKAALEEWIVAQTRLGPVDRWVLINNAGVLGPVGMSYPAQEAADHMAVNLTAPIAVTRQFLAATDAVTGSRLIVNISSGAATTAYAGWSLYCSSKAGLDHFGRVVAAEQQLQDNGADLLNIAPGSFATEMQDSIRDYDESDFPHVEEFRRRHREGLIPSVDLVAQRILRGIARQPSDDVDAPPFNGRTLSLDALDPDGA